LSSTILAEPGKQVLFMGNEAIARGAVEAGLQLMAAYPGTPSSEVGEVLLEAAKEKEADFYVEWSTNEKIAFEMAAGASLVGARSMTAMKNAGLNVAMDTFMTLPYGGCKGGFLVVVADDPNAHYSSTEQDTRVLAAYAEIPCLEPEDQQEAKDMARAAFDISESLELPVFLRSVSRISHASGDVLLEEPVAKKNALAFNKHYKMMNRWNVYGPPGTLSKHIWLHSVLPQARAMAEASPFNKLVKVKGAKTGILASGLAFAYAKEAMAELGLLDQVSCLKLGFINPLPEKLVAELLDGLETLLIAEEGDPVVENAVRAFAQKSGSKVKIYGKSYDGIFQPYGELNSDIVVAGFAKALGLTTQEDAAANRRQELSDMVIPRSSTLCAGCSHLGSYSAMREALRKCKGIHIVNGDIGCYEQGGYGIFSAKDVANDEPGKKYPINSPYEILDTIYAMGSGIGLALGQSKAGYKDGKIMAVAGDSTFIHATLPAVVDAVYNNADITFVILDNYWTCMTGHQSNPNTTYNPGGADLPGFNIEATVKALGIQSIGIASSYDRQAALAVLLEALDYEGPAVVILTGECQLQLQRRIKKGMAKTVVASDLCNGCKLCVQLGCPAIKYDTATKKSSIDPVSCTDCTLCIQVCQQNAISMGGE